MAENMTLRIGVAGIEPRNVHFLTYVRYLVERGHEVTVVTNRPEVDADVRVCDFTAPERLTRILPRGLRALPRIQRLHRCLTRGGFDVVNVQQMTPDGVFAALLWRGPLVLDFWGSDIHRLHERPWFVRRLMRLALGRADAIHSVSRAMTQALEDLGAPRERIETFQYGIDFDTFAPGPRVRPGRTIVSSRGLRPFYRVHEIVRAMPRVLERVSEANLVIMGPGDDASLRELVQDLGLEGHVEFAGLLGQEAVADRLRSAHVWVSLPPSDGTPLSLLEAMAAGAVPVVADVPSVREWIDEARGVIVDRVDAASVADGIVRAFEIFDAGRHFAPNLEKVRRFGDRSVNLPRWERMLIEAAESKRSR